MVASTAQNAPVNPWQGLEQLTTKARGADSEQALLFVVANETYALLPYRSALVFTLHHNEPVLGCASGLTSVDRGSAFGAWSEQVVKAIIPVLRERQRLNAQDVPESLRTQWHEYWPETVQVHPIPGSGAELLGVVVYVTEQPWPEATVPMLNALHQMHGACLENLRAQKSPFDFFKQLVDGRNLKTRKVLLRALAAVLLILLLPIRQFVIAPAEIISLDAIAVTSPVEGIVSELVAKPNQPVKKGDVLIRLDDTAIRNRLESARQALEVSRAEYLAGAHRAFVSSDKTAEAGVLKGRINERLAEVAFLEDQMGMLDIRASRDGIAVYGQENDWIGKPVSAGQRIMELADSAKVGINAWVPVADAINMRSGENIHVLLYTDPLSPLTATIEQASYQATKSPDGVAAYRVRATLPPQDKVRLGLRGNAKINGEWVVLGYFIFRRPLAAVRQWLGV
jgi:multidrug resistance efflux pump